MLLSELCTALALLVRHEVLLRLKAKEWKMFVILQDMDDDRAYKVFTLLHLPLYAVLLVALLGQGQVTAFYILDIFLIVHTSLHLLFEKNPQNGFKNFYSRMIIYPMGFLAIIHIIGLLFLS